MADISQIKEIITDITQGKMVVLLDSENRENEGDLVISAQHADFRAINFMARYGRGLICLALDTSIAKNLDLKPMVPVNTSQRKTAFTYSIEAKEGITTGISAYDRAKTIAVAIDKNTRPSDLAAPGHVFPVIAKTGGVLERAGHTEASVELTKLAGLRPAAVICEVMRDDGQMARLPDLISFSKTHNLKLGLITDLITYYQTVIQNRSNFSMKAPVSE